MAISKKKLESNKKWDKENIKRIGIAFRKDEYDALKEYCNNFGFSVNGYCRQILMKSINYSKDSEEL